MGSLCLHLRFEEQGAGPTCSGDLARDLGKIAELLAAIAKAVVRDLYLVDLALPGANEGSCRGAGLTNPCAGSPVRNL